jgi:hypothetical protein
MVECEKNKLQQGDLKTYLGERWTTPDSAAHEIQPNLPDIQYR